jgi:ABC-2 type transport system ATP-binding protein
MRMIEARGLTKRYGATVAVDDVTFTVPPGIMVNGKRYAEHRRPLHEVGALLEARAVHTGRSARNHLLAMAATAGIGRRRVDQVIDIVGLGAVADRRAGAFSLGMGQRLGIASALLADPKTLILDEPVNGLDPDGIRWIRSLLRGLADEGRTVLLSSHLMSEMALTAEHVIVVGKGRLLRDQPMSEFIAQASADVVRVRSPEVGRLAGLLRASHAVIRHADSDRLEIEGMTSEQIGTAAAAANITLFELTTVTASLEEAYMALTEGERDFRAGDFGTAIDGAAA